MTTTPPPEGPAASAGTAWPPPDVTELEAAAERRRAKLAEREERQRQINRETDKAGPPSVLPAGSMEGAEDTTGAPPAPAPEPSYPNVESWVTDWFAPIFGRRLGATRWCAEWWKHEEAVFRLEALWRSWEMLRLDVGMGMAIWIRDHLDSGRRELLGPDGPFQACEADNGSNGHAHNPPPPLPVLPPPAGWPAGPSTEGTAT